MIFNKHLEIPEGSHALFSASQSSWLRYDIDKILDTFENRHRTQLGTELHEYVSIQIILGNKVTTTKNLTNNISTFIYTKYKERKILDYGLELINALGYLPSYVFETVKTFINDANGYRMASEVRLKYSEYFHGTTDAISFRNNVLRISDLKTGDGKVHTEQLYVYAALFCLEYNIKPTDITIELRVYQLDDILTLTPTVEDILPIMDRIISLNKVLLKNKLDVGGI